MKKFTTLLLTLLLVIPAMAHNLAANSKMYFEKPDDWAGAQFMVGHNTWSEGYLMNKISNTKLYYYNSIKWDGYTEWIVFEQTSKWGGEGNNITHRTEWMGKHTEIGKSALGTCNLLHNNGTFTKLTDYNSLNHVQTVTIVGEGSISMSSYKLSGNNSTIATTGTTSVDAVYTATVNCTATAADGYQFIGWYDGETFLSELTSYSYTAENGTKTITAKFDQLTAETPVISNFTATPNDVKIGETITFSCEVENGNVADVIYTVNGEALDGNTWTPNLVGTYTVSATLEGAVAQTITIEVGWAFPEGLFSYNEGEFTIFYINTEKWANPYTWVWLTAEKNYTGGTWPGQALTKLDGTVSEFDCYKWTYNGSYTDEPTGILFSNKGSNQTADKVFVNGGVYDGKGNLLATIEATPVVVPTITLGISSENIYTGDEITISANILNGENFTVKYLVDDEEIENVDGKATWIPDQAKEYVITVNLMDGEAIKATDSKTVTVKESTVFYVYLEKASAWETSYIHYWGSISTEWPGIKLSETEIIENVEYYKTTFKNIATINIIFNNNAGKQTKDIENVTKTTYYRITSIDNGTFEASETPFETEFSYEENILCETNYFLYPNEDWKKDGAWFAAYFQNKNTGAYTWVKGEMLATNYVLFYLSQYNVPENAAAPARAKAEDMPVYTHVTFHRMDAGATEMVATNSWNEAGPLTYDGEVYKITGWNHSGEWVNFDDIQTAIKDVEVANGITYAYGVVQAEGAIEVYNMNGAVVAHGNDNVDLRGLNGGVYIVRCGDNVRKVVR